MKTMLKKSPVLILAILLVLTSASYAAPATEVKAPADAPVVEPVVEKEAPADAPAVEPADEAETPAESKPFDEDDRRNMLAIVPPIDKEKPPQQEYHYLSGTPLFAFWEENDCIIHADPDCMKIPDDTPFTGYSWGTLREAVVAGHTEWCPKCSPMKTVEQE